MSRRKRHRRWCHVAGLGTVAGAAAARGSVAGHGVASSDGAPRFERWHDRVRAQTFDSDPYWKPTG